MFQISTYSQIRQHKNPFNSEMFSMKLNRLDLPRLNPFRKQFNWNVKHDIYGTGSSKREQNLPRAQLLSQYSSSLSNDFNFISSLVLLGRNEGEKLNRANILANGWSHHPLLGASLGVSTRLSRSGWRYIISHLVLPAIVVGGKATFKVWLK